MRRNTRSNIAMKDFGERLLRQGMAKQGMAAAAPIARESAAVFGTVKTIDAATRALIDEAVAKRRANDDKHKRGADR